MSRGGDHDDNSDQTATTSLSKPLYLTTEQDDAPAVDSATVEQIPTHLVKRVLSDGYRDILAAIVEDEPESISALADTVDRSYAPVYDTIDELADIGVVGLVDDGHKTHPILRPDGIVVLAGLTPGADLDSVIDVAARPRSDVDAGTDASASASANANASADAGASVGTETETRAKATGEAGSSDGARQPAEAPGTGTETAAETGTAAIRIPPNTADKGPQAERKQRKWWCVSPGGETPDTRSLDRGDVVWIEPAVGQGHRGDGQEGQDGRDEQEGQEKQEESGHTSDCGEASGYPLAILSDERHPAQGERYVGVPVASGPAENDRTIALKDGWTDGGPGEPAHARAWDIQPVRADEIATVVGALDNDTMTDISLAVQATFGPVRV